MQHLASTPAVTVGRFRVSRDVAIEIVRRYVAAPRPLDRRKSHGFDIYDAYRADSRYTPLDQPDLLVPVLLGAQTLTPNAYRWLTGRLDEINAVLERIGPTASLCDPEPDLALLGELFSILDDDPSDGVRITILSKILHRKRPRIIPLWDAHSLACYSGVQGRVPHQRTLGRSAYAVQMARAMHEDLRATIPLWEELARLSAEPELTELRALDIIAWTLGRRPELATASDADIPALL